MSRVRPWLSLLLRKAFGRLYVGAVCVGCRGLGTIVVYVCCRAFHCCITE